MFQTNNEAPQDPNNPQP